MAQRKDSDEVIDFMSSFARMKELCGDDPNSLLELADGNPSAKRLCVQLWEISFQLRRHEQSHRNVYAAPVDPEFISAWRDFEERYDHVVSDIHSSDFPVLFPPLEDMDTASIAEADLDWEFADDAAAEQARAIEGAIDFAHDQATETGRDFDEEGRFVEIIQHGKGSWERLKYEGFDLRGVFRRRSLIPFVLIPRHVSSKHGGTEIASLLGSLRQAHEAFIFGTPFAALALMRSLMEAMLRDHYDRAGNTKRRMDLKQRIDNAQDQLPPGASAAALHRLRQLANSAVHLDSESSKDLPQIEAKLEREIISLLFVLRALIEGAPQRQSR